MIKFGVKKDGKIVKMTVKQILREGIMLPATDKHGNLGFMFYPKFVKNGITFTATKQNVVGFKGKKIMFISTKKCKDQKSLERYMKKVNIGSEKNGKDIFD